MTHMVAHEVFATLSATFATRFIFCANVDGGVRSC